MRILVTGGAGFIGSAFVRMLVREQGHEVLNLDKLTYAASPDALEEVASRRALPSASGRHLRWAGSGGGLRVVRAGRGRPSCRREPCRPLDRRPRRLRPDQRRRHLRHARRRAGTTGARCRPTGARPSASSMSRPTRSTARSAPRAGSPRAPRYDPNSPYAASKAAADHLARAWHRTYGLPVIVTNCSNNYGPYQFPEKLIPLTIIKAAAGEPLPVYGKGENVRDWIHVEDHARGIHAALTRGRVGRGLQFRRRQRAHEPRRGQDHLRRRGRVRPEPGRPGRERLITFVTDRPGPRRALRHRRRQGAGRAGLGAAAQLRAGPGRDGALVPRASGVVGADPGRALCRRPARSGRGGGRSWRLGSWSPAPTGSSAASCCGVARRAVSPSSAGAASELDITDRHGRGPGDRRVRRRPRGQCRRLHRRRPGGERAGPGLRRQRRSPAPARQGLRRAMACR